MEAPPASPSRAGNKWALHGKRCLVTGGTKGIGKATVEELAALGAKVYTCSRNQDELSKLLELWRGQGYDVSGQAFDLSKECDRTALAKDVREVFDGTLDVLVNNVGINIRKKSEEYSSEEFNLIMGTNLESAFSMSQLCFPLLRQSGRASIIMNSSVAGGPTSMKSGTLYAMSKGAMNQLVKYLSCEWAKHGIRCNAVAPWYTSTPLANQVLSDPAYHAEVVARTPMGRTATPEEIANVIAFFCMEASAYVTGQIVRADGGYSSMGFW